MKIYQEKPSEVISNNESNEEISFEISSNDEVIIDMLRRNYAYPIQTPVQEYLCNARDATREAKSDKKIIVTIPNSVEPLFKIRDFGVGLSPERVTKVFTKYGESTKRNTNEQTGGYGIGAKSAFIYSDSFTVISYYNGIKYTYLAIRSKNNEKGSFNCIRKEKTKEDNGVEIIIPVNNSDFKEFERSVYRATFFWENRPEIKGISEFEIPEGYLNPKFHFKNEYGAFCEFNPDFSFGEKEKNRKGYGYHIKEKQVIFVIDGIPYKNIFENFEENDFSSKKDILTQVYFFKTGEIKLPPHREEIIKDSNNEKSAYKKVKDFTNSLRKDVANQLNDCSDLSELVTVLNKAKESIGLNKIYEIIIGEYTNFETKRLKTLRESNQLIIKSKSKIVEETYSASTSRRGWKIQDVLLQNNFKDLIFCLEEKQTVYYFNNDYKGNNKRVIPAIKNFLKEKVSQRRFDFYIQILDNQIPGSINVSSLVKEKVKGPVSTINNKDYISYYEILENDHSVASNKEMIMKYQKNLKKEEKLDITDCVYLETSQNSLYKNYEKISKTLLQSIIRYLLSKGVQVLAFSEKNKEFFENGTDFSEVIDSLFEKYPLTKDEKYNYLACVFELESVKENSNCLFNHYYNYVFDYDETKKMIPEIKNEKYKKILNIRKIMTEKKNVCFNSEFVSHTMNKSLQKEISELKKESENFINKKYAFKFCQSFNFKERKNIVKYINEG